MIVFPIGFFNGVKLPIGATTGPITLITPLGQVNSPGNFTVV